MSDYALVQRGNISASGPDASGFKDAVLGTPVKPGSSFVIGHVRAYRGRSVVERGIVNLTNADTSPEDVPITDVDDEAKAETRFTHKEVRPTNTTTRGFIGHLTSPTNLRIEYATLAVGETLDIAYEVSNTRGGSETGTLRLFDASTVRLDWDGNLLAGDFVTAQFEVFDLENFGDDMKEALFRMQLILGQLGANAVQDSITFDDAGNMTTYRIRIYDTKDNAEAADLDIADSEALDPGELLRIRATQDIDFAKNDRNSLIRVEIVKAPTPGVN